MNSLIAGLCLACVVAGAAHAQTMTLDQAHRLCVDHSIEFSDDGYRFKSEFLSGWEKACTVVAAQWAEMDRAKMKARAEQDQRDLDALNVYVAGMGHGERK